ncbi:MAG TPA: hypothetical protein VL551_11330 [Actinospica sp.]|jgi:hypothetical protein|nr:hypothetical protein [Actinospica sp.]
MDARVAASFSAAGLSFISVILGLRSHRRSDTEQWCRDRKLPLVAEIMELSDACSEKWKIAAAACQRFLETPPGEDPRRKERADAWKRVRDELQIARDEHRKLREKLVELDLVAGRSAAAPRTIVRGSPGHRH